MAEPLESIDDLSENLEKRSSVTIIGEDVLPGIPA